MKSVFKPSGIALVCLLLASCYRRHTCPREAYILYGHVADCSTGAPVQGANVTAVAAPQRTGFFSSGENEAGNTVTDANGNYSMRPFAYEDLYEFDLAVSKSGYNGGYTTIAKTDIGGAQQYELDTVCLSQ